MKSPSELQKQFERETGKTGLDKNDYILWLEKKLLECQDQERWIPVTERLPDQMGHYICVMDVEPDAGARIEIVFYAIREYGSMAIERTGWGKPILHDWANNTVTHWMSLPELPKEVKA
jgi:hypothetical protein